MSHDCKYTRGGTSHTKHIAYWIGIFHPVWYLFEYIIVVVALIISIYLFFSLFHCFDHIPIHSNTADEFSVAAAWLAKA
jgi:hypothetical protein